MDAGTLRRLVFALAATLVLAPFGCSTDDDSGSGSNNGEDCQPGYHKFAGECIPDQDTGGNPTDTGQATDTDQTTDTDPGGDTNVDPDTSGPCSDGQTMCSDNVTLATCESGAWVETNCGTNKICQNGRCDFGTTCTPGEVFGCYGQNQQFVCQDNGIDKGPVDCPAETPYCTGDGECTETMCTANDIYCAGNRLMECSADGTSSTELEVCQHGCDAANDQCASDDTQSCGGKGYIGCDFWAADLDNYSIPCTNDPSICSFNGLGSCGNDGACTDGNANAAPYAVTVSNTADSSVDVEILDGAGNSVATGTVAAGALQTFDLPRQDVTESSLTSNSYHVTATGPVTVHQFNPKSNAASVFSNDASLLLPSHALGSDYLILGWPSLPKPSNSPDTLKAYTTIIATEDGTTTVDVTSPVALRSGNGVQGVSAGGGNTYTLSKGQVLQLAVEPHNTQARDPSGMTVSADQNVAVFVGHECANVPVGNTFCDHMEQQIYPTNTWGSEYVVTKFAPRGSEPDVYRITAAQDGTSLTTTPAISGVNGQSLNRGQVLEFKSTENFVINASGPISVAQFMVGSSYPGPDAGCDPSNPFGGETGCAITLKATCSQGGQTYEQRVGDPAFLLNVASNQYRNDYFVLTPTDYEFDYLNFVFKAGTTITLDGNSVNTGAAAPIGNTDWRVYRQRVQAGAHQISASNPVGLTAYGYKCDVSYAYPGGLDLRATPTN